MLINHHRTFAPVPPKGWNSWDGYGASVREEEVRKNAEYMSKHLKQFGWEYIVVDIQWYEPTANSSRYHDFYPLVMDNYSRLLPDPGRFPSVSGGRGFKPLADYVHSLGLKFGIHIMRGIPRQAVHQATAIKGSDKSAREIARNNICPWNSDMYGVNMDIPEGQIYYNSLMDLYASWGVDFVKCDDIANSQLYDKTHKNEVVALRKAIAQTGRQIVLSLSPGPAPIKNGSFFQRNANMWRITNDFWDEWPLLYNMFDRAEEWAPISRPGNWPDCDMLPLGHIGIRSVDGPGGNRQTRFTHAEQRTMMSLWSLMQSPLIMGGELTDLDDWTKSLLTNSTLLKMDNSISEKFELTRTDQMIVWYARSDHHVYYGIFNISSKPIMVSQAQLKQIGIENDARDVWHNSQLVGSTVTIGSHDVLLTEQLRR
ncbi:glycoside hydrolase family 27 protein [Lentilactobacillus buchneri]|uniref:Alpha-galactosidase n=1 Tax=Lentilactobacillus buchneri subsp. silagei CD034 TaxID=1071400 RepID=J9W849_LENBU|nr:MULTISPECIES: glycoside hydrolase family 27 protein [Lentilactobacillus]MCC6101577.1 glycoside hydrolase family 27 protein [Lactobacillus sp.]AFS01025.1 putative alpha-galactosidase [Lentilactobacillus buchneri subsp. silagei CD034]MCT2899844.1 glycoside hydrolase family 27 protein [Lentilactobacillus buchneri]MCT3544358.1 glycoside hydrolase family 27 protein [Lentilactobacillus buchneri]MCT3553491.1 glycoside hydrolase family 27 protein [Lentilactobacillus buchneri]